MVINRKGILSFQGGPGSPTTAIPVLHSSHWGSKAKQNNDPPLLPQVIPRRSFGVFQILQPKSYFLTTQWLSRIHLASFSTGEYAPEDPHNLLREMVTVTFLRTDAHQCPAWRGLCCPRAGFESSCSLHDASCHLLHPDRRQAQLNILGEASPSMMDHAELSLQLLVQHLLKTARKMEIIIPPLICCIHLL